MFFRRCAAEEGQLLGLLGLELEIEIVACLFETLVIFIFLG